ncbi:transmembrane channel-like protein 7 [Hyperolius riggenbachi]|uniref:transmembrane channel-like protein 7 n=1 Tax=Hyperolius riggenbachi TaxID=752182 RepID=UPI0035A2E45D
MNGATAQTASYSEHLRNTLLETRLSHNQRARLPSHSQTSRHALLLVSVRKGGGELWDTSVASVREATGSHRLLLHTMDGEPDNDVFLPEGGGGMVSPNQFLYELPSYQSLVRRKPSNYGTMDSRRSVRNPKRSLSREPSRVDSIDDDFSVPLRDRPISMQEKRQLRNIQTMRFQNTKGWGQWKDNSRNVCQKFRDDASALLSHLQLWRGNIHGIEGKFGTGIGSYFSFLRFLVLLNFVIFLLMFCFTTLPVAISKQGVFNSSQIVSSTPGTECAQYSPVSKGLLYFYNNIIDLLSGTGFLEMTYLFYGYYTIDSVTVYMFRYSLPLAYIMVTFVYLLLSIIWIVKRAVEGFKQSLVHDEDRFQSFCNKIFAGWDFCITDQYCAQLKHSSLQHELKTDLAEERIRQRKEKRTRKETIRIYSLRFFLNIIVISVLGVCFYAIYLATSYSQEHTSATSTQKADRLNLLIEYLPSIVITIANFITPLIFEAIVRYEDYAPAFEIRFTLIRCVFVRLASIAVLLISLWSKITSCSDQGCQTCGYNYKEYPCWETRVGQEMYKLMIFDFLIIMAMTIFIEFPRKLLVTYCAWKPAQWWGQQEFEIPQNVLEIVYGQTICFIGTFYSPLLPAIATIKYFIIFYVKKITLMENCRPATRPFRASSSKFFFQVILLIGLVLACIPVGLGIAYIPASKACGPFSNYNTSWQIIPSTVDSFPDGLKKIIYVISSESFAVPFFLLTCLVMFYFIALAGAHRKVVEQLQEQLVMESRDKMFLIRRLTEAHSISV